MFAILKAAKLNRKKCKYPTRVKQKQLNALNQIKRLGNIIVPMT